VKSAPFEYHAPETEEEALSLMTEFGEEAKVIAGGQSLVPLMALRLVRVGHLIDINRVTSLTGIDGGEGVMLGAMSRHRSVERSPLVAEQAPLVAESMGFIGHMAIRSRGTVGGSLAHADPAAEWPALLMALDGSVVARSVRGRREVGAAELFTGFLSTSLEPDELVTSVRLPPWDPDAGWSVQEFARRYGDFALAGAVTVLRVVGGKVTDARVALLGLASTVTRAASAEKMVLGESPSAGLWTEAAERAVADLDPPSDLHGSGAYRRHLAKTLVRRSFEQAAARAEGAA
jgi:carbon-monoxide dehydrogenase medium subunit